MWQLLPIVLYLSSVHALFRTNNNNPYPFFIEDRGDLPPQVKPPIGTSYYSYPRLIDPRIYETFRSLFESKSGPLPGSKLKPNQRPNNPNIQQRFASEYMSKYNPPPIDLYHLRSLILHQSKGSSKTLYERNENNPFDTDYGSSSGGSGLIFSDTDPIIDPKAFVDSSSYAEDLELVENFGTYLRKRTLIDPMAAANSNDAAHQYNALLAVLIALARAIRNSCADFEQVYDNLYYDTVETYYKYGLANADKVAGMIEEYIRKGNSHIPKLKKLKQDICDKEIFCSVTLDNHVKTSPLMFVKELETLEALAHLARSYYPYIEEFNQASQKGTVLAYLQRSKDRLKEYIMHIINSVEHITDRQVICP